MPTNLRSWNNKEWHLESIHNNKGWSGQGDKKRLPKINNGHKYIQGMKQRWTRIIYLESEYFPGPNKLPTRSVFDLKLALSFNCQTRICCYFITTNCSVTSLLFRYDYIGHSGALACRFVTKKLVHAYHKLYNRPRYILELKYWCSKH
jgi:hypothetical protein